MSSAELRAAASHLRELAGAATPGDRWARDGKDVRIEYRQHFTAVAHTGTEANAAFIAALSPTFALAVADWLDTAADDHELRFQHAMCDERALAVARALVQP